jgi:L-lactate dehydrogenase complex protein LldE
MTVLKSSIFFPCKVIRNRIPKTGLILPRQIGFAVIPGIFFNPLQNLIKIKIEAPEVGISREREIRLQLQEDQAMPKTVQLFVTCIIDTLYPETGEAVVRVLQKAGVRVSFPPGQTCCGQPAFNAGLRAQASKMAIQTILAFEPYPGPVVVPSGSCASMIRHSYPELFANDPKWLPRALALVERTYEFSEFLVDVLGVTDLNARFDGRITYHSSCHLLRGLGVDRQPRALLASVREAEFVELPNSGDCCGFGGVFSVEHPEISTAMLERKITNLETCGASVVVSCDAGCVTNINGGLHRRGKTQRAVHIAEILDHN